MAEYLTKTEHLTAVADAIRTKGGTSEPLVYPDGFVSAIQAIPTGGSSAPVSPSDITFYDYEGTVVAAWTLAELAGKTALPDLPSHEGLICQGWNWSLADLKTTNRKMNVGAMYITDDGKTRIYIHLEEGRTSPMLGVCPNGTVTVDWGDGTTLDTLTGTSTSTVKWTPNHAYAAPGDYVIKLTVDGATELYGVNSTNQFGAILRHSIVADARNDTYKNCLRKIEIGSGIISIGGYAFNYCTKLDSVTIPNNTTNIGINAFGDCYNLVSVTIPNSVTSIGYLAFGSCMKLASVAIPNSVTRLYGAFNACRSITKITIPDSVTNIDASTFNGCFALSQVMVPDGVTKIGDNAFNSCAALNSITIPNGITSINNNVFNSCYALSSVIIPDSVKSIGSSAFSYCYTLQSVAIPDSVTNIGSNAFIYCRALTSVTIPYRVTSIGSGAFRFCYALASVTILGSVTSVGGNAFEKCGSVAFYDFTAATSIPTLANTNAFTGIPDDCEIRVPAALVDEWKAATNWATYADHIVGV